ncbi:ABC transporter [Rickettsiales bacterium]|nr:ABC transporter [Rickettsiales bacterium]
MIINNAMHTTHNPIEISGVYKSFNNKQVLKDVNLSISKGEIFGLVGLNGSGKTTLIKIMLALSMADEGTISLFGKGSKKMESRKKIAYLPEKFQPSSFLKGEEFLAMNLAYKKISYSPEKSKLMCGNLALDQRVLKTRVGQYSKGMGQKLGLVGAFLTDADLYILDEPASGLDHQSRMLLKKLFINTKKLGKTILFSSHILSDIEEICDRIAIIHDSKILFVGTASELCKKFNQRTLEQAFMHLLESDKQ